MIQEGLELFQAHFMNASALALLTVQEKLV
jgi:hypothetical protein